MTDKNKNNTNSKTITVTSSGNIEEVGYNLLTAKVFSFCHANRIEYIFSVSSPATDI